MVVYYAHCMAIYGTLQENRDITTLEDAFGRITGQGERVDVFNPNNRATEEYCKGLREKYKGIQDVDVSQIIMDQVFRPLVEGADVFAFRGLPDGTIPAGVVQELRWAQAAGIPVVELPSAVERRTLSVAATREYLKEIGQR